VENADKQKNQARNNEIELQSHANSPNVLLTIAETISRENLSRGQPDVPHTGSSNDSFACTQTCGTTQLKDKGATAERLGANLRHPFWIEVIDTFSVVPPQNHFTMSLGPKMWSLHTESLVRAAVGLSVRLGATTFFPNGEYSVHMMLEMVGLHLNNKADCNSLDFPFAIANADRPRPSIRNLVQQLLDMDTASLEEG
jgi:hypothetical protein